MERQMEADRVTTSDLAHAVGKPEELDQFPAGIHEAEDAKGLHDLVAVVSPVPGPHVFAVAVASPAVLVL